MGDAVRPADDTFNHVLQESFRTWSSYLASEDEGHPFPQHAIDLGSLVCQTPPFLGGSAAASDEKIAFACEEKQSTQGKGSLVVNAQSTWRTSTGKCDLPPRVLSKQLLLAVGHKVSVRLSTDSPFSHWPGVHGLSDYDEGNYLSVLYLAWAYILSARWVELLGRSRDHECQMSYSPPSCEGPVHSNKQHMIQIDIGDDACAEEVSWWRAVLCSDSCWDATTKYNGHEYLSPWSLSATGAGLIVTTKGFLNTRADPPDSWTALEYLRRFCVHHRLYAQCSVALAGVLYIPFMRGGTIALPFPKESSRLKSKEGDGGSTVPIQELLKEHGQLLAKYMTLSSNVWGLRSILCSTFFNKDIECNLVSAWLNPAFAILDSISSKSNSKAAFLINRQPRIGILWLGALLTDLAKSILRDVRAGMTAVDLPASAWTETSQSFLSSEIESIDGDYIHRDDECRLLFITAFESHDRPPIWPWKPFGATHLSETELSVFEHAWCTGHYLEYDSWEWILTDNRSIKNTREQTSQPTDKKSQYLHNRDSPVLEDYTYNFFSQSLSEGATRGIFRWLRSTGYPSSERPMYQLFWFDMEGTDDEEAPDDEESDVEMQNSLRKTHVQLWLEELE